jgi:hypothetical protein
MESSNRSRSLRRYLVLGWASLGWAVALILLLTHGSPNVHMFAAQAEPARAPCANPTKGCQPNYNPIGLTFAMESRSALAMLTAKPPRHPIAVKVSGIWIGDVGAPAGDRPWKGFIPVFVLREPSYANGHDEVANDFPRKDFPIPKDIYVYVRP